MTNRLKNENSLYLQQHSENPVNWWPWCSEAFEIAKDEKKLVLISIGYSSCHWCHVMAHECFEDKFIAELMNQHFVCIKVDREERPDLDQIYMDAVQMITNKGGWPLNVFCLPNGKPFFGGTYFPPKDRGHGLIPWPQLLMRISDHYRKNPEDFQENAENIVKNLELLNNPVTKGLFRNELLLSAAQQICKSHDNDWGGFGLSPKFPPSMILDFLLKIRSTAACDANPALKIRIDQVVQKTLKAMAHGGLYDQIGGGFTRYSVDQQWIIPHFEKMLYDNGLLIDIYIKGWLRYRNPLFLSIIEETIQWLVREMSTPYPLFSASLDADSEGEEGGYYVWTPDEVEKILGKKDAKVFCDAYNITEKGNFENTKTNLTWVYDDNKKRDGLKVMREKMLTAREKRVPPSKDSKILLSWNCLSLKALATAGFYLDRDEWFNIALEGTDWIWENMRDANNRLISVYNENTPARIAFLDDYNYYIELCLLLASKVDSYEKGKSNTYVNRATELADAVIEHFHDDKKEGYFFTADDHEELIARRKAWYDNAYPSGNSSLVHIFSQLYAITSDNRYLEELNRLKSGYQGLISTMPSGVAHAMAGLTENAIGIVIIKVKGLEDWAKLRKKLAEKPYRMVFLLNSEDCEQKNTFQVCIGEHCLLQSNDLGEVMKKL